MKWCVLLTVFLQSLLCSGLPLYQSELASMADRALGVALADVNAMFAVDHLYRVTRASVSKAVPTGLNTYDLIISFGVKETICPSSSREDPQSCGFKPGFFVSSSSCSTRVRVSAELAQLLSLRCGLDHSSSSSSESSSEGDLDETHVREQGSRPPCSAPVSKETRPQTGS